MTWLKQLSRKGFKWGLSQSVKANVTIPIGPPKSPESFSESFLSPAELGIITGFVFAYFINYKLNQSAFKVDATWNKRIGQLCQIVSLKWKYLVKVVLAFTAFVIFLPLILLIVGVFKIYRQLAVILIKRNVGNDFAGMLEGHDAVWAIEHPNWLSVINILATLEGENGSGNILLALRKRMATKLLGETNLFPKMFYRRKSKFGYSFWMKVHQTEISIEDYIKQVNIPSQDDNNLTEEAVKAWIGKIYNSKLPHNHEASWEILVSKRTILTRDNRNVYPIFFRVHHSLGDGVALIRFFLETIADKKQNVVDLWHQCTPTRVKKLMTITTESEQPQTNSRKFRPNFKVVINFNGILEKMMNFLHILGLFLAAPLSLAEQAVTRKVDDNYIHNQSNQELCGDSFVEWFCEPSEQLFYKIKAIKNSIPGEGIRFSDVFLSAFSMGLQNFLRTKPNHKVPKQITTVVPLRMEPTGSKLSLQNRFSVGLQTLPILDPFYDFESMQRNLILTKTWTDEVRSKPDYLINYWILGCASSLFPSNVLGPMVFSRHSTLVVSNLPGPEHPVTINKFNINSINFWLPNRGTTGLGITLLTYDNRVQFGIGGDKRVLPESQRDAKILLKNTLDEIENMYVTVVQNAQ